MVTFLQTAPAIMSLDISGMFIGETGVTKIILEGVKKSKTLASLNFANNEVSHWGRIQIYRIMKSNVENLSTDVDPTQNLDENGLPKMITNMKSVLDPTASFDISEDEAISSRQSLPPHMNKSTDSIMS